MGFYEGQRLTNLGKLGGGVNTEWVIGGAQKSVT